jgi:hypothetical protein
MGWVASVGIIAGEDGLAKKRKKKTVVNSTHEHQRPYYNERVPVAGDPLL